MADKTKPKNSQNSSLEAAQFGNEIVLRGPGGETHQVADGDVPVLTTAQGIPVYDDQNSINWRAWPNLA
jgi:catalase